MTSNTSTITKLGANSQINVLGTLNANAAIHPVGVGHPGERHRHHDTVTTNVNLSGPNTQVNVTAGLQRDRQHIHDCGDPSTITVGGPLSMTAGTFKSPGPRPASSF